MFKSSLLIISFLYSLLISNSLYSKEIEQTSAIQLDYELNSLSDTSVLKMLHDSIWYYFDRDLNKVSELIPVYNNYVNTIGSDNSKLDYYMILGAYYNYININDSAIIFMERAINIMNNKNSSFTGKRDIIYNLPSIYNNIALIYDDIGMYESAVEFQLKSINTIKKIRTRDTLNEDINSLLVTDYVELAMMYSNFNDTLKAKKFFLKGIYLSKNYSDEFLEAYAALNYGIFLSDIEEFDLALENINYSQNYYKKENNIYNNIIIDLNIAKILAKQDNIDKAISIVDSIYTITEDYGYDALKLSTLEILFYFYYDKPNIEEAIRYADKYIELANFQNQHSRIVKIYSTLSKIYDSKGHYEKAFSYLLKSKSISDSINDVDHQANAKILEAKYNLIQRNTENEVLIRENKIKDEYIEKGHKTRTIIILLLIISIIFGLVLLCSFRRIKKINFKLNESNQSLERKSIELAQYNSALENVFGIFTHDLKGPIGTADMFFRLLEEGDNNITEEKKSEYIKQIGKSMKATFSMLENLLYWSKHRMDNKTDISSFCIHSLINNIIENIYLTLFTKGIQFNNTIDETIFIKSDKNYLRIVLRNLISNAVKFTHNNGVISINYSLIDNKHHIAVTDNGIGMTKEQSSNLFKTKSPTSNIGTNNERGTGIGLLISLELVRSLGGKINIESEIHKGSTFVIILPA